MTERSKNRLELQTDVYVRLPALDEFQKRAFIGLLLSAGEIKNTNLSRDGDDLLIHLPDDSVERSECLSIIFPWCEKYRVRWTTNYQMQAPAGHPWHKRADAPKMSPDEDPEELTAEFPEEPTEKATDGFWARIMRTWATPTQ